MTMGKGRGYVAEEQRARSRSPTGVEVVAAAGELRTGALVRLHGLKGAAHLNGMTGICSDLEESSGRWVVRLGNGEHKSLKADNLAVEEPPEENQDEAQDEDDDEEAMMSAAARMASDLDSGFICCSSLASAKENLEKKESRLEFGGVTDADERSKCLDFVCELLESSARQLHGLSFVACGLDAAQLRQLAGALKGDTGSKLTEFGVSKNAGLEAGAWQELFEAVPRKVFWLDFGDNQLTDADFTPLISGLEGREELDKLYLDGNLLHDLSKLCTALPDTGVTNLDLGDNRVDDAGAQEISLVLPVSVVTVLILGSNPISEDGVRTLFEMLPRSSLDILYLDSTGVNDDCLQALGAVLNDSKLTELHIDSTKISDEGVRSLLPHLSNSELTYIDISDNNISDETAKLVEQTVSTVRGIDGTADDAIEEETGPGGDDA